MEMYSTPLKNLIFKFSNSHLILIYYSEILHAQWLMSLLCKSSRNWWNDNYKAFWNAFEYMRKQMEYTREFDDAFAEYLLEQSKYNFYELTVSVSTLEGINSLMANLIGKISDLHNLKFKQIKLRYKSDEFVEAYNKLYKLFVEKKMDPSWFDLHPLEESKLNSEIERLEINKIAYAPNVNVTLNDVTTISIYYLNKQYCYV